MYQYCGMCGTRISEGLRFCPNCGASLAEQNEPEGSSEETAVAANDTGASAEAENPFLFTGEEIPVVKQEQDGFYIDDLPAAESINKRTDTVQPLKRKKSLMPGILTIVLIFAALVVFGIILNKDQTSRTPSEETETTAQLVTKSPEDDLSNEVYSLLYYIDEKTYELQYDDSELLTEEKNVLYAMVQTLRNKLDTLITDSTKTSLLEHLDKINDSLNNISAIPEKDPNDISYDEYHAAEYSGHYTAVIEMNNISKEHIRATVSLLQLLLQDKLSTKELLPEESIFLEPASTINTQDAATENDTKSAAKALDQIGFYDFQGITKFVRIERISTNEGCVMAKYDYLFEFKGSYFVETHVTSGAEVSTAPFTVLDNDVINIPSYGGAWRIFDRIIIDSEKNAVWLKLYDEESNEFWLISYDSIDWSKSPESGSFKIDTNSFSFKYYLK